MKKILTLILGNQTGLLSAIAEKGIGKLSFKRIGAIMIISWIVKDIPPADLTWMHAFIIIGCLAAIALPKIFTKE